LLDELPDPQREILVLRVALGMSAEDTAGAVGSTPGAVRVAQHRALARLRSSLADARVPSQGRASRLSTTADGLWDTERAAVL